MSRSKYNVAYQNPAAGFSCVAANDRTEIVSRDQPVWSVSVRRLAVIASVQIHVGPKGDPITLRQGERITFRTTPAYCGIFFSAAAGGAGALAEILAVQSADDDTRTGSGPAFEVVGT